MFTEALSLVTSNKLYKIDLNTASDDKGMCKKRCYLLKSTEDLDNTSKVFLQEMLQLLSADMVSERISHSFSRQTVENSIADSSISDMLSDWNFNTLQAPKLFGK